MPTLSDYLERHRLTDDALAKRAGISQPTVNRLRRGQRRPSPEVARRIELATNGEVSAAGLLGLESAGEPLRRRRDGKCAGVVGENGVTLTRDVLAVFGVKPGDYVTLDTLQDGLRLSSRRLAVARNQAELRHLRTDAVGVVDEFLAERRAEAARE